MLKDEIVRYVFLPKTHWWDVSDDLEN